MVNQQKVTDLQDQMDSLHEINENQKNLMEQEKTELLQKIEIYQQEKGSSQSEDEY